MRLLPHALLWQLDGDRRLTGRARRAIGDPGNAVLVSAASAWEIATKARFGKLPGAEDVSSDLAGCLASQQFDSLDITVLHAQRAGGLVGSHRHPFDRMLIAQAQMEDLPVVTNDPVFDECGVRRLW